MSAGTRQGRAVACVTGSGARTGPGRRTGTDRPDGVGRDEGSGTVLMLAVVAVVMVLAGLLGVLASAQGARGRAQTAADLAALAGAQRIATPGGIQLDAAAVVAVDPCATARDVAARNGADLRTCAAAADGVVEVTVTCRGGVLTTAGKASARAGPAGEQGRRGEG